MSRLWWQGATSLCVHPGGNVLIGWENIREHVTVALSRNA
jgi:hypothetical protein